MEDLNPSIEMTHFSIKEWVFHNISEDSIKPNFFFDITYRPVFTEIEENQSPIKISFNYTGERGFKGTHIVFCDKLILNIRPYSLKELTEQAISNLQRSLSYYNLYMKSQDKLYDIKRFISNELTKKEQIINSITDQDSRAYIKASSQKDTLNQISSFINELV